MTYLK